MEKYKYKSTVYLVFMLVSLFINGVLLYMLIFEDNKVLEEIKEPEVTINKDELVNEAIKVYQGAYEIFNGEDSNFYVNNYEGKRWGCVLINLDLLEEYFTQKALAKLSQDLNYQNGIYIDCKSILKKTLAQGLFSNTEESIKNFEYVLSNNDTLIVSGKLEYDEHVNSDTYPLYMILKYDDNKWKIDKFE